MSSTADLPDLTVWLALIWPERSHHEHAVHDWEAQASDQVLFSTVTALGLVRLVSQPKLMGPAVRNASPTLWDPGRWARPCVGQMLGRSAAEIPGAVARSARPA